MIRFIEVIFATLVLLGVLYGVGFGCVRLWDGIVTIRRRHRLERDADDRAHRKALAEDFAEATQQLGEGAHADFNDYLIPRSSRTTKAAMVK